MESNLLNTNRTYSLLIAIIALTGFAASVSAADYKIGVVNAVAVLEAAPQSDAARKKTRKGVFFERQRAGCETKRSEKSRGSIEERRRHHE